MKPETAALAVGTFVGWLALPVLAHAAPSPSHPFADGRHVVVLGSSTAAGWGPSEPESAWVNRFTAAAQAIDPERTVTNLAVPGFTTYHVMASTFTPPPNRPDPDTDHNITAAMADAPDAIIINLPSNDVVNDYSIEEQLANYDAILTIASASDVPVWITTTQPRDLSFQQRQRLMEMRDSTYARFGDKAIDFWSVIANPNGTINEDYGTGDGIHLNDAAHAILFQRVDAKDIWGAIATGVAATTELARTWRVFPASPNPFRRETTLSYSLASATHVAFEIYDVRGRKVQTLEDRVAPAGTHRVRFEGRGLPSGLYFYRLRTSQGEAVGKVVLLE